MRNLYDDFLKEKKAEIEKHIGRPIVLEVIGLPVTDPIAVIRQVICNEFNINWSDVEGTCRVTHMALARQFYCYFTQFFLGHGVAELGRAIKKDHTTAIHAIRKIQKLLSINDDIALRHYNNLVSKFSEFNFKDNTGN